MTPSVLMAQACEHLKQAGIIDPRRDAQKLWEIAFSHRFDDDVDLADANNAKTFRDLVHRRASREPMSHLTGLRDFYNHSFIVSPKALDPRPDTETLVALALEEPFVRVLDLGTGTGCILLSLLAEQSAASGLGVDVSAQALSVAGKNLAHLRLKDRCELRLSNWFDVVDGTFDLIVSNPPYIAVDEMDGLQPEVRLYEPRIALTDEADGLSHYRHIIANHAPFLRPEGRLLMEIGPSQGAAVRDMMLDAELQEVAIHLDFDGRDRVVSGRKKT